MPELPYLTVHRKALERLTVGQRLVKVRLVSPFLLRTAEPPLSEAEGGTVLRISRIGKRLIQAVTSDLFLVVHLMIAGRLHCPALLKTDWPRTIEEWEEQARLARHPGIEGRIGT